MKKTTDLQKCFMRYKVFRPISFMSVSRSEAYVLLIAIHPPDCDVKPGSSIGVFGKSMQMKAPCSCQCEGLD